MTPERWRQVTEIFHAALARDADGRTTFIDDACGRDRKLRAEVDAMLAAHNEAGGFGDAPLKASITDMPRLVPGTAVGPYRIEALIGAGGMGEVYRARDTRLNRHVAIKVLPQELAGDPRRRARLLNEARAAAALNHPNICTIHEVGHESGLDYVVLEYIDGQTLDAPARTGALPIDRLLDLAVPLSEALDFAHRHGIVHRDLKPSNVMVSPLGQPKILDFGLAKDVASSPDAATRTRLTDAGVVLGTAGFMSPEQALGRSADARSDLFSLGCLLYEIAAGRPAFTGATPIDVLNAVVNAEPAPLASLRPELPLGLVQVIEKALRKDPAERYQHASDLAADLRHLRRQSTRTPDGAAPIRAARSKTLQRGSLVFAATLVCATLVAGFFVYRSRGSSVGPIAGSIAVMYVENLTDPADRESLGRMLANLVTTELSATPGLRVVSSQRLYDLSRDLGRENSLDRSIATEVARRAGAEAMLIGHVARTGDKFRFSVEVVDVASGRVILSRAQDGHGVDDIFSVAKALGTSIAAAVHPVPAASENANDVARSLTTSVDAYRAFTRGEAFRLRSDFRGALAEYREAARLDPQFALAYDRISSNAGMIGDRVAALEASTRLLAYADRLPREYQEVAKAVALRVSGQFAAAMLHLQEAIRLDPSNAEAISMLAEEHLHSGRDNDPEQAVLALERLRDMGVLSQAHYSELAYTYAVLGKTKEAQALAAEMGARWPGSDVGVQAWLRAFAGEPEAALQDLDAAAARDTQTGELARSVLTGELALITRRWDVAETAASRDPERGYRFQRGQQLRYRGHFYTYRGAFASALTAYTEAAGPAADSRNDQYPAGVRAAALTALAELQTLHGDTSAARRAIDAALTLQPENPRWLFFAGRAAARRGGLAAANAQLAALRRVRDTTRYSIRDLYCDALEAEVALASGQADKARALAEKIVASPRRMLDYEMNTEFAAAAFRDTLARAWLALGRHKEAASAFEGLVESGVERVHLPVVYARALHAVGRLKLDLGDATAGCRYLRLFLEHWDQADWDLPDIRGARAIVAARCR